MTCSTPVPSPRGQARTARSRIALLAAAPGRVGVDLDHRALDLGPPGPRGQALPRPVRVGHLGQHQRLHLRGRDASSSSAVSSARTSARGRSIRPASTAASVSGSTGTSRVASSSSRSAAGLAIPRVTISSWITAEWSAPPPTRRPAPDPPAPGGPRLAGDPLRDATTRRSRFASAAASARHPPKLLHSVRTRRDQQPAPSPRRAHPRRQRGCDGCRRRAAAHRPGARGLGRRAWTWQKPRGHHRQSRRQNRPGIPLSTRDFELLPGRPVDDERPRPTQLLYGGETKMQNGCPARSA